MDTAKVAFSPDREEDFLIRPVLASELPAIAALDHEAFADYGTAESPQTFHYRFTAYPQGFLVLLKAGEIAGYGCAEKWDQLREPVLDENPLQSHRPGGKVFCITGMAVKSSFRGKGYGLAILDAFILLAKQEECEKVVLETTHAQGLYRKRGFRMAYSRWDQGIRLDVMMLEL